MVLHLLESAVDALAEIISRNATTGIEVKARSVSRQFTLSIIGRAIAVAKMVLKEYIKAGPMIIRTAFRSFVALDIKSPVRLL
jgi:hypothetical protein